jgi:peptidoglycan/LPS O-acetylase OafA/YrhL
MPTEHDYAVARNPRIDFLRGIAICCVLILHFSLAYGMKNSPLGALLGPELTRAIAFNGNYGVTIFFVISGYLITANSMARWNDLKAIDARTFYIMRFARIMPSLVLALAIIVCLGCLNVPFFNNTDNHQQLPASYFFISVASVLGFWHNVLMQSSGYVNYCIDIYWSLSVEEVFYLLLPLLCLAASRTWLIVVVCLAAILIGPIYRSQHTDNEIFFMYAYQACFDSIALGCLTALAVKRITIPAMCGRVMQWTALAAIGFVYLRGIDEHEVFGFSEITLASAVFIYGAAHDRCEGWLTGRLSSWVRWLGQHSYEMYLFHIIVLAAMRNAVTKEQLNYYTRLPWFALFLSLSALVAWLVARYVSEPANVAIRQRFGKSVAARHRRP